MSRKTRIISIGILIAALIIGGARLYTKKPNKQRVTTPIITESLSQPSEFEVPQETSKTVLDYYYEIPSQYFMWGEAEEFTRAEREEAIVLHDVENYFVEFSPLKYEGSGSMAVFVTPEKAHLIALETKGCGPACEQKVYLLNYKKGSWLDLTDTKLPKISRYIDQALQELEAKLKAAKREYVPINLLLRLPQYGTTLEYYDQFSEIIVLKNFWYNGAFNWSKK